MEQIFLQNKYTKWYMALVTSRKLMKRDGYVEKHHIIPVSLGGSNDSTNLVSLTAREHFIAHLLLTRMTKGMARSSMSFALAFLMGKGTRSKVYVPTSKIYEIIKKNISNAKKGKTLSPEHIEKLRLGNIGRKHPPRSEQWKELQRAAHVGRTDPDNPLRREAHTGAKNPRALSWEVEFTDGHIEIISALKPWCTTRGFKFDNLTRTLKTGKFYEGMRLLRKLPKSR